MNEELCQRWVASLYASRRERRSHPEGKFDDAGRWYPSACEDMDGFSGSIRSPSRAWPHSYMLAARTKKHCSALVRLALAGADTPPDVWAVCPARADFADGTPIGIVRDWVLEGCTALA